MARLTRKEKQAHTRQCLLKSAARVFARRGLQQASTDEVADAAGDDDFREERLTRYRSVRDRIAAALQGHADDLGKEAVFPSDQVALMTCAMANGFALEKLLEGEAVPDELYGTMLMVFFAGLEALHKQASGAEVAAGVSG